MRYRVFLVEERKRNMGKLNLLHHKSWHVYSKENRERVRKDEEAAVKEENGKKERVIKAEQEARLEKLRDASSARKNASESDSLHLNLNENPSHDNIRSYTK